MVLIRRQKLLISFDRVLASSALHWANSSDSDCYLGRTFPLKSTLNATNNNSPLVAKLQKLLFRRMLVGVNDGRFFLGVFHCIDKQGNIILQDAVEYRNIRRSATSPMDQRCLGLILIPASCRSSCHVDCSIEEQLSLVSLQE
ncbi:hypothetical protein J5N97_017684 [Dioscorea zingiberensis]|uniref:Sm domain-containing protein n=1 Tax=Dioscorea zingiberensis TaxID=325984 RepID=A0A9D5CMG6_9LILI|nr:hypothetical protein J5N97_017684 [Dioscorea zingiberensis]